MKFRPMICPQCHKIAHGTVELLKGVALMTPKKYPGQRTSFEYDGETEIDWDSQRTAVSPGFGVILTCNEGHEWPARQF